MPEKLSITQPPPIHPLKNCRVLLKLRSHFQLWRSRKNFDKEKEDLHFFIRPRFSKDHKVFLEIRRQGATNFASQLFFPPSRLRTLKSKNLLKTKNNSNPSHENILLKAFVNERTFISKISRRKDGKFAKTFLLFCESLRESREISQIRLILSFSAFNKFERFTERTRCVQ